MRLLRAAACAFFTFRLAACVCFLVAIAASFRPRSPPGWYPFGRPLHAGASAPERRDRAAVGGTAARLAGEVPEGAGPTREVREKLGPRALGHKQEMVFLGRGFGEQKNCSEKVARDIDDEVRRLVQEGRQQAEEILRERMDTLHRVHMLKLRHKTYYSLYSLAERRWRRSWK